MTDVMLKPEVKTVRVKTIREVCVEEAVVRPWRPYYLVKGSEWGCTCEEGDHSRCLRCCGTGVPGGYESDRDIGITAASYEEVVDLGGEPRFGDDFVSLTFECVFQSWIFPGCVFTFDEHHWKVLSVEELEEDEDDDGGFLPDRWEVLSRRLEEFDAAYVFLEVEADTKAKGYIEL